VTAEPRWNDLLSTRHSDARFLVVAPGTAKAMPELNAVEMMPDVPRACGTFGSPAEGDDLQLGRRYVDSVTGLTLLCVWPGSGFLSYRGRPLVVEQT
jgi:hypothetical protein